MSIEIKIPKVGESISEVQISEWLKSAGDSVRKDEPLAIIDSEKTTFELPASDSGTLSKILHQAGETVGVGEVVAQIEPGAPGEPPTASPAAPPTAKSEPEPSPPQEASPQKKPKPESRPPSSAKSSRADTASAPLRAGAPQAASEKKQDTPGPEPSKPRAKEVAPDSAPGEPPRPAEARGRRSTGGAKSNGEEEIVPMTMLRRTVARRLVEASQSMAMLTTFNEVDMSAVQRLRQEHQEAFRQRYATKLGLMSFFVKAAIDALKQFPQLNAEVRGNDIVYRNYYDIGVAIAMERGLVVPVLRRAERLSFAEIEKGIGDFARRAQSGELQPEDLEGGTFTITNGGVFGSLLSTPIINPPQSGILGLHSIEDRPVARDGAVVVRQMMYVALTYDHRIVDGREAVLFLRRLREAVENPARMLLEI